MFCGFPVDDSLAVCMTQGRENLLRIADDFPQRKRPPLCHVIFESNSLYIFHDNIFEILSHTYIVNIYNIGMRHHRNRLGFIDKTPHSFRIVGNFVLQHFDGDSPLHQPIVRPIYNGHAADADDFVYFITAVDDSPYKFFVCFHTGLRFS